MVRSFQEALLRIDHHDAPKAPIFDLKWPKLYKPSRNVAADSPLSGQTIWFKIEASLEKPRFFSTLAILENSLKNERTVSSDLLKCGLGSVPSSGL